MTDIQAIRFLWRYMVYADAQIIAAAETVSDEGYSREQNISVGSLEKLLNHAMLAQRTWLQRLNGLDVMYVDDPAPTRKELPGRWAAVHQELLAFADVQTPGSLQRVIRSRNRGGKRFELPTWTVMLHVADHATYHRGQLNSMIKLAGGTPSPVMLYPYSVGQGFGKELPSEQRGE
ncbi:MAG TPA: DinB family protein [Tepidisphaeraceae bacterium]|jgi:uncharacterized damage-inducible protein DinB